MRMLSDGSVLPSTLNIGNDVQASQFLRQNVAMRSGVVVDIYYTDDARNISKRFIEYDVMVAEIDSKSNSATLARYRNCRVNNIFATSNNYVTYTLQAATENSDNTYKNGAEVTLLCLNGYSNAGSAIIIGGLDSVNSTAHVKADGQFYEFQFNGLNININKDGEYTITQKTPIDQDGNVANKDAAGSQIKIDKDGRISVSDNESQSLTLDRVAKTIKITNGNDSILVDKENKKISVDSSGKLAETSKDDYTVDSSAGIAVSSDKKMSLKSGDDISMDADKNLNQTIGANWSIDVSGNVQIQSGGNVMIQGGALAQLQGLINKIGDGSAPAAGVGISQCFGSNGGGPMFSTILTGSATVLIGS